MFKEFKNGTDVFIEYLTPILNSFKEKHEFLKQMIANIMN